MSIDVIIKGNIASLKTGIAGGIKMSMSLMEDLIQDWETSPLKKQLEELLNLAEREAEKARKDMDDLDSSVKIRTFTSRDELDEFIEKYDSGMDEALEKGRLLN